MFVLNQEDAYFMTTFLFPYPVSSFILETGITSEAGLVDLRIEQVDTIQIETSGKPCSSIIG